MYSGIEVDLLFLERLVRDQRAAQIDLALDLDAGGLERLRVDLGDDELLGEVLRADANLAERGRCRQRDGCGDERENANKLGDTHGDFPPVRARE